MSVVTPAEIQFVQQCNVIETKVSELYRLITELPVITEEHQRPDGELCDWKAARVVTTGLEQWCRLRREGMRASTNGWQDMGDMHGPEFVVCTCGRSFASPPDMNWD